MLCMTQCTDSSSQTFLTEELARHPQGCKIKKESSFIDLLSKNLVLNLDDQKYILTQLLKQLYEGQNFRSTVLTPFQVKISKNQNTNNALYSLKLKQQILGLLFYKLLK